MKLAAIGSNCVDYYLNLNNGTGFPGGGPVNMAVYTIRLGGEASYTGPVGKDRFGEFMKKCMTSKGIDVSHVYELPGKTAISEVELKDNERVFGAYDEGVLSEYKISPEELEFIASHDVVVCDLWGKVQGCFQALKDKNVKTAFDCATNPDSPVSVSVMPFTDYLFFSSDLGDTEALREKMREIKACGPEMVIAMLGEKGSLCFDGQEFISCGIVKADPLVDTMGAGDSYIAGFLYGITEGKTIKEAMQLGAENATETLMYFGAWEYDINENEE